MRIVRMDELRQDAKKKIESFGLSRFTSTAEIATCADERTLALGSSVSAPRSRMTKTAMKSSFRLDDAGAGRGHDDERRHEEGHAHTPILRARADSMHLRVAGAQEDNDA